MRTTALGSALILCGVGAGCGNERHGDRATSTGFAAVAGQGGAANGSAKGGTSGADSMSGAGGAPSSGATSGTTGAAGARSAAGGTAGHTAGAAAGEQPRAGATNEGATTEAAGEGGAAGEAGAPVRAGTGGQGASGTPNLAGSGGRDAGASGSSGVNGTGGAADNPVGLSWPIDCIPGDTCLRLGYPDTDGDGKAHDCGEPGYVGHEGTDIDISPEAAAAGTAVRAAADGVVTFAFDGKYDQCPNASEPDCEEPSSTSPGSQNGTTVCTPIGDYCGDGDPGCYWCFAGGNVIVIRHAGVPGVFATRYDHLKRNSVLVEPGDTVTRGQQIAEAASAGNSTRPHLHFEVWGSGFYELTDPWAGPCGPNTGPSLWAFDPPWVE